MNDEKLTPEQQYRIRQVEATMAISGMPLTEEAYQNLVDIETGRKTTEQIAKELKEKYGKQGTE